MPKGLKWLERAYPLKRKQMAKTEGMKMNEHMKISEEIAEELKDAVERVVKDLEMEIDTGTMTTRGNKFTYNAELRTGYGLRSLQTSVDFKEEEESEIWAASYNPYYNRDEQGDEDEITIVCKDPVKGIAYAVRYALVNHVTPEMKRILEERTRMKSPTEELMELKRDAQKLLDRVDERMRRYLGPA